MKTVRCKFLPYFYVLVTIFCIANTGNGESEKLEELARKILALEQKIIDKKKVLQNRSIEKGGRKEKTVETEVVSPTEIGADRPDISTPTSNSALNLSDSIDIPTDDNWYKSDDFSFSIDPKNHFSVSLGLVIPGDTSTSKGTELNFDTGVKIGFDYQRSFTDRSYIGAGIGFRSFNASGNLSPPHAQPPLTNQSIKYEGDCSMLSLHATLGQNWSLSNQLSLLTQASAGLANSDYNFEYKWTSPIPPRNESGTSFYYSFLLGLNLQLNRTWYSSIYYELDGRSEVEGLDYQTFHQIGLRSGLSF